MKDSPEFAVFTTRRIAIVESDRTAAEMLHTFLRLMDLECSLVDPMKQTSESVIDTLRRFDPQAVIVDFDLPHLRALELAHEIRCVLPRVAIVFASDDDPLPDVDAPVVRKPRESFEGMLLLLEVVLDQERD